MQGDSEAETVHLQHMCSEAKAYLESFPWCTKAQPMYYGGGVGKIFCVFLFEIVAARPNVDRWLWVVLGDIPRIYLVLDECRCPSDVLRLYVGLMEAWIELARQGKTSDDLPPIGVEPTPEWAKELEQRLRFIRTIVAPFLLEE